MMEGNHPPIHNQQINTQQLNSQPITSQQMNTQPITTQQLSNHPINSQQPTSQPVSGMPLSTSHNTVSLGGNPVQTSRPLPFAQQLSSQLNSQNMNNRNLVNQQLASQQLNSQTMSNQHMNPQAMNGQNMINTQPMNSQNLGSQNIFGDYEAPQRYNGMRRMSEPVNMLASLPLARGNPSQWLGMGLEYLAINPGAAFLLGSQGNHGPSNHAPGNHAPSNNQGGNHHNNNRNINMERRISTRSPRLPPTPEEDLRLSLAQTQQKLVRTSGASTVAIDNKIEQAMDLVKSHLMFAVREEVEVLKEQIKELLEKNSQLEYENNILRNEASSDTLAKIQQSQQQPPTSSS